MQSQTAPTSMLTSSQRPGELPWAIGNPPSPSPMSGPIRNRWATRWTCAPALWRTSAPDSRLQVQWVPVTVESCIPALLNGTIDLEWARPPRPWRQEQVDFSSTTFHRREPAHPGGGARGGGAPQPPHRCDPSARRRSRCSRRQWRRAARQSSSSPRRRSCRGLAALEQQSADAYALDRIILIGLALAAPNPARFALADRYFSYEPYALMLRRGIRPSSGRQPGCWRGCTARVRFSEVYTHWLGRLGTPRCSPAQLVRDRGRARVAPGALGRSCSTSRTRPMGDAAR